MIPKIILFKIFLSLSIANAPTKIENNSLNDFVIKKQSTYNHTLGILSPKYTFPQTNSGSVMHKVSTNQELAIFCKMEHELMKASGFAVKFRLGDQAHVDQLEGK